MKEPDAPAAAVAANLRLAHWAVRRYLGMTEANPDYWDRVQDASIALWRAAKAFDPGRRATLTTFAAPAMFREIVYRQMVADRHGFSRVGDGKLRRPVAPRPVSLDAVEDDADRPLRDLIPAKEGVGVGIADGRPDLWAAVAELPTRLQRKVVRLAYRDGLTDAEISNRIGRSRATVFETRKRAVARLRAVLQETA